MLMAMRRGAAGWVAKILFGLLILSFAAWGIGDYLTPEVDPVIAEVGEVEIRRTALDRAERQQLERMRQLLGQAFNANALPENAVRSAALQQLVDRAALDMEAATLGLDVGDQGAADWIRSDPQFQTGGAFDAESFRRTLFAAGMSEDAYVAALRGDLIRAQITSAIAAPLPPPLPLAEAMFVNERQRRSISYVSAETAAIEAPEPTDEDLKSYVAENAARFAEPERRDVRAIVVSNATVAASTTISDAEASNYYEDTKAAYSTPETRSLTQALFQSEEEARAFAVGPPSLPKEFTAEAEASGAVVTELGKLTRGQVFPAVVGESVFGASEGATTKPVQTALGWHVVLVSEVTPAATKPLEEVAEDIKAALRDQRAVDGLTDIANAVEDALAAGDNLQSASNAAGIPVMRLKGIDRSGRDPEGAADPLLPADPGFLADVFSRQTGDRSGLIELSDGTFFAVIVDAVQASAPKPLEAVRDDAAEAWRDAKRQEIAADRLQAMMDAGSADAFQSAAAAANLAVKTSGLMSREELATTTGFDERFVGDVFSAKAGETLQINHDGAVVAAFVAEVSRPSFDPNGEEEKAFIQSLAQAYAGDRNELLSGLARATHPATISAGAMTSVAEAQAAMGYGQPTN